MPSEPFHRNHVAIVSQTPRVPADQLMRVSAAVQKQVARDFRRYWNIDATVDAFGNLRDVPLGYWQIVIRDDIPYDAAGIHLTHANGQPFALVRYSTNWSLTVSHECLEMLADPSGNREHFQALVADRVPGNARRPLREPRDRRRFGQDGPG